MARLRAIGPDGPPTRRSAEQAAATRRNRVTVGVGALLALVVIATSFPLAGLLSQHRQLAAAAAQLNGVQRTNHALTEHVNQLNSKADVQQLARERYQLVAPGATLYDVLPPGGHRGRSTPGAPISGDPGSQPPVAPADAPDLSPDPNLAPAQGPGTTPATSSGSGSSASSAGSSTGGSGPTTFWSRVGHTLEFWR